MFTRTVVTSAAFVALLALLTGCSEPSSPSSASAADTPTTTSAPPVVPADGTDVQACADGSCEVAVEGASTFGLDGQRATVEATGTSVRFALDRGRAGGSQTTLSVGSIGTSGGPGGTYSFSVTGLDAQGRPVFRLERA